MCCTFATKHITTDLAGGQPREYNQEVIDYVEGTWSGSGGSPTMFAVENWRNYRSVVVVDLTIPSTVGD